MDHLERCDALAAEIERFASLFEHADTQRMVPTCPAWTVHELAEHLGTVHQWAEHLVRVRAQERISRSEMDLVAGPVDAAWLRGGGHALHTTLVGASPDDSMWAWGVDHHVRFWSRRQLHETFVHRIDLELAMGVIPVAQPSVATDAIDELLVNLTDEGRFAASEPDIRSDGELLKFNALDTRTAWVLERHGDVFRLSDRHDAPDVELTGLAGDLLLVLYRRQALHQAPVKVQGNATLIDSWLSRSALE